MPNELFRHFVSDTIDSTIRLAQSAPSVGHPGMTGSIREIALKNIFRPILTDVADIGSGKITDHRGHLSKETDVIIYSKDINPPILYDTKNDLGIFPAETCLYAIEVKSKSNSAEIQDAIEKAQLIKEMEYTSGIYDELGREHQHTLTRIVSAFFAFSSDLKEKSELDRYLGLDSDGKTDPLIRAICIVGRGYWYFDKHNQCWWYWKPTSDHGEVIAFIGGVINTIPDAIASRGRPRFGKYLINTSGSKVP